MERWSLTSLCTGSKDSSSFCHLCSSSRVHCDSWDPDVLDRVLSLHATWRSCLLCFLVSFTLSQLVLRRSSSNSLPHMASSGGVVSVKGILLIIIVVSCSSSASIVLGTAPEHHSFSSTLVFTWASAHACAWVVVAITTSTFPCSNCNMSVTSRPRIADTGSLLATATRATILLPPISMHTSARGYT